MLWYMRACDVTTTKGLNSIGQKQSKATEVTKMWADWMLDYLTTHPNAKIRYWQSDMRLVIHSDASFLTEGTQRAITEDTFIWDGIKQTTSRRKLTEQSMRAHLYSPSSQFLLPRQNSGAHSTTQKRARYYA